MQIQHSENLTSLLSPSKHQQLTINRPNDVAAEKRVRIDVVSACFLVRERENHRAADM